MKILNLTQHVATADQLAAGVVEPADKQAVQALITFDELPNSIDVSRRARALARLAKEGGYPFAMIGGAPYFMAPLEQALDEAGVEILYAFSKRESVEVPDGNGGIKKTQIFKHAGFISDFPLLEREDMPESE